MNHQASHGMMEFASGSGGGRRPGGGYEGRKDVRPDFDEEEEDDDDDDEDEDEQGLRDLFEEFQNDADLPDEEDDPDDYADKGTDCSRFLRYSHSKGLPFERGDLGNLGN